MKKNILFYLYLTIINYSFSQKKIEFIYFPRDENFLDTFNITHFDKKFTFKSERIFFENGTFSDSKILCVKDSVLCGFIFKKDLENNWYLKSNTDWKLFYNSKKARISKVKIVEKKFMINPIDLIKINNEIIYSFQLLPLNNIKVGESNKFWFSPYYGIIGIQTSNSLLIRNDFSEKLNSFK